MVIVVLTATATRTSADDLSLRVEPSFRLDTTDFTDATGQTERLTVRSFGQDYRLTLDKTLYGTVRFSGTGTLLDSQIRTEAAGVRTETDDQQWNGAANLVWGNPVLGGGFGYSRADTRGRVLTGLFAAPAISRGNVNESWSAFTRWRPIDLPSLHARLARSTDRAVGRELTSVDGTLKSEYVPVRPVTLAYTLGYADTRDELVGVETTSVSQTARAAYSDELFGRSSVYLAYNLAQSSLETEAPGEGGIVSLRRPAVAGLSLVVPFGGVPEADTLEPNPRVIDGATDGVAASTGMNIGWGPAFAGDTSSREIGLQLADETEPVNTLHVWVDLPLPPAVAAAYGWTVYRSDDNLSWTAVAIVRGVVFGLANNRFEITTQEIRARYVKVAVAPLSPSQTSEPGLQNVFVTELEAFHVVPAASVIGKRTAFRDAVNGTVTTRILPSPNLRHDLSFNANRREGSLESWILSNGLSMSHRLTRILSMTARAARTDSRTADTHVGQILYGGALTALPSDAFASTFSLSGTVTQAPQGTSTTNGAAASARARVYEGVDASGNVSYRISTGADDRTTRSAVASATTSITPHRVVTITAGAATTRTDASGGGFPSSTRTSSRLDLSAGSNPYPALFLSAGVTEIFGSDSRPRTLANFGASWSPATSADLTLQLAHSQSIDTLTESVARSSQASVRWRILRMLEVSSGYTLSGFETLQSETNTRGFFASLLLTLF